MKILHNEKGIALVTSLMFTVLSLIMTMALLYMVTASIRTSGAIKIYRTSYDALGGGSDIMLKDLISATFAFHDYSVAHPGTSFPTYMKDTYMVNLNSPDISACLRTKLTSPKSIWPTGCIDANKIENSSDVSFDLNSVTGQPFVVYSKIVDTMERKFTVLDSYSGVKTSRTITMAGNSDTSSFALEAASVTDGSGVAVPHYPYMYRIEIQAQRKQNPNEKSKLSVQYAY